MIEITKDALKNIADYFGDKEIVPVRVFFLNSAGWSGPGLALALDEVKENDTVVKDDIIGITIVADKDLIIKTGKITIDFTGMGFNLQSENKLDSKDLRDSGCSGCSGSCSEDKKGE